MNKLLFILIALLLLTFASAVAGLHFGPAGIASGQVVQCLLGNCESPISQMVIWKVRVPRVLVALVAGMGLAIAGAILQNTTRRGTALKCDQ